MSTAASDHKLTEPLQPLEPPVDSRADGWDLFDTAIVVVAFIATFVVHPIHDALTQPYWLDEAWVAVLTRVPWSHVTGMSSSTPVGFLALLKLVPGSGEQRGRLLVLAFSAGTVVLAYVFARGLRWASKHGARFAGVVAAFVAMLAPLSLLRNDLKQYTCDAFCALVILVVAARVERDPDRTRVWWLGIAAVVVLPFSSTSAFVAMPVLAGLLGSALLARSRRRVIEVVVTAAATGLVIAGYFGAVIVANTNDKLRAYWNSFYLYGSLWDSLSQVWRRLAHLRLWLGMPALVFVVLVVIGIVALVRLGAPSIAIALPLLWIEMGTVAHLRRYPFLDLRTSHFLLMSSFVVGAVGAAWVVQLVYRWNRLFAVGGTVLLAWLFSIGFRPWVDTLNISYENARAQAHYVANHRTPNDVILVNSGGSFGFSYYWPHGSITTELDDSSGQGFRAQVKGLSAQWMIGRTDADVLMALRQALRTWHAAGPGSRLFIVRSHVLAKEALAWKRAFAALDVHPRVVHLRVEPLLVLGPASPAGGAGH
jgi:hypothetical protein